VTPREIADQLARDAEGIARMLLPNGKREGAEWRAGSVAGDAGKSLGVHLTGDKAGVWSDFASGEGGDLLDLWAALRGLALCDAIREAKAHLGITEPRFAGHSPRQYSQPKAKGCKAAEPQSLVAMYLSEERGLSSATLAAYRIAERGRDIVLPSFRDGILLAVKYLGVDRVDGKKKISVAPDCEPCLFGWQAIPDNARTVAITEGEIDAMTLYQLGVPALSVPFGGGKGDKQRWIESEFEHLERFDTVYLCLDADQPGKEATEVIAERLGRHRCKVVDLPAGVKDANDLLGAAVTPEDVKRLFASARTLDPAELKAAQAYVEDVLQQFYPSERAVSGFRSPWERFSEDFAFRQGEVSILAGINGHGKSEAAGHITLSAMAQGQRACIASMEFRPARWLYRLTRQAAALPDPSRGYVRAIHGWYSGKLWVFDVVGTAKADRILEVFAYARKRYGITLFVIDNLAKCGFAEDDYNGQKGFVDRLTDFAKDHDCHVLLVAHLRKREDETKIGGKMDIKGSGALTDMADSVLIIWRNKVKEEEIRKAEYRGEEVPEDVLAKCDAVIRCEKQRNGEDEPMAALWFCRRSHQFLDRRQATARRYVEYSGQGVDR